MVRQHDGIRRGFDQRAKPLFACEQGLFDVLGADDQALDVDGTAKDGFQFLGVIRLGQVGEGALDEGPDGVLQAGMTRQDDNGQTGSNSIMTFITDRPLRSGS